MSRMYKDASTRDDNTEESITFALKFDGCKYDVKEL